MPRTAATLQSMVIKYYLSAPMKDIDDIQPFLREIYNHRKAQYDKAAAGMAARKAELRPAVPVQLKKGKGKSNGRRLRGKQHVGAAAIPKGTAETGGTFGGKPVTEEATA